MLQEKGGLVALGGRFARPFGPASIDPSWMGFAYDGSNSDGEYEFTLTEVSPGRGQVSSVIHGGFAGCDMTQYGGDMKQISYLKPSDPAGYETFYMFGPVTPAGVRFLYVQYNPAVPGMPPFGVAVFTWVKK